MIRFYDADLLYALHDATLLVKGTKDENNKWNLEIGVKTNFMNMKYYYDNKGIYAIFDLKNEKLYYLKSYIYGTHNN